MELELDESPPRMPPSKPPSESLPVLEGLGAEELPVGVGVALELLESPPRIPPSKPPSESLEELGAGELAGERDVVFDVDGFRTEEIATSGEDQRGTSNSNEGVRAMRDGPGLSRSA